MSSDTRSGRIMAPEFLQGLIDTLTQRGRAVLGMKPERGAGQDHDLEVLGEALLSRRGEASGVAIAQSLLAAFQRADEPQRLKFLASLADRFGPDRRTGGVRRYRGREPLAIRRGRAGDGRDRGRQRHRKRA